MKTCYMVKKTKPQETNRKFVHPTQTHYRNFTRFDYIWPTNHGNVYTNLTNISLFRNLISAAILILFTSCNGIPLDVQQVLENAGNNRSELEKVIDHYKEVGDDEKLKAAYHLIGNMNGRYYMLKIDDEAKFSAYADNLVDNSTLNLFSELYAD